MHNVFMIIRREYLQRVRKKSFWIGTLVVPLLVGLMFLGQFAMMMIKTEDQRHIAIVDNGAGVAGLLAERLGEETFESGEPAYVVESFITSDDQDFQAAIDDQKARVASDEIFGVVTIGDQIFENENFGFQLKNVGNERAVQSIENELEDIVVSLRLEQSELGIDRELLDRVMSPVRLDTYQVSETGESKKKGFIEAYIGTFAFVMILYVALLFYGIAMMRGVLEEKSNRVMEVLLGSVSAEQLMSGKIVGIGLVGLTQMLIYAVTGGTLRFIVAAQQIDGGLTGILDAFAPMKLIFFVIYFLLGYTMFTSLFAAVGAVCNTEQEAQNLQFPVMMGVVVPMLMTFFFVSNPGSTLATTLSLVPLFTPMLMFMRISVLTPPAWQIALSIFLMLGTIWFLFKMVARIFRVGILMYGKRPTVKEIFRWARQPV
ncbi:MAG: ABC transporter permease [Acidobacteriota bacterium]|nr:ABC transporter permease [Acidobacteriota bacterium]MDH3784251.1 ABC transporter permease [Acidobacteriota bacterium]